MLVRARAMGDPAERLRVLERAEALCVERDAPVVPLFHYTQFYLFDPKVLTGLSEHPRQIQQLFLLDRLDRAGGGGVGP
jgi:ABC-type oligopeptide transport system substrate-binding subunit